MYVCGGRLGGQYHGAKICIFRLRCTFVPYLLYFLCIFRLLFYISLHFSFTLYLLYGLGLGGLTGGRGGVSMVSSASVVSLVAVAYMQRIDATTHPAPTQSEAGSDERT